MEFWAVEVGAGKPLDVQVAENCYLHVSQAALGEMKGGKGADERVVLKAHVGKQEVVLGTLVPSKTDQISFDLIFHKGFKLSHSSKVHSVFFCGYTSEGPEEQFFSSSDDEVAEDEDEDEDDDEKPPALKELKAAKANGEPAKDLKKPDPVKKPDLVKEEEEDEDEDEEDDDEGEDDEDEDDEDESEDEDEDEEDESEEEDEETPNLKKRSKPATPEVLMSQSMKKQKPNQGKPGGEGGKPGVISTPGKKSDDHKSTPASGLKEPKTGAQDLLKTPGKKNESAKESKDHKEKGTPGAKKTPGTPGQFICCGRNFTSQSALDQHKTAKHKGE